MSLLAFAHHLVVINNDQISQAQILAEYKPTINFTQVIPELKRAEQKTAKAVEYFNTTRHIVLCYKSTVRVKPHSISIINLQIQASFQTHSLKIFFEYRRNSGKFKSS